MPAPALRPLTAADAEATAALIRDVFTEIAPRLDPPPSAVRETAASIAATLARGAGGGASRDGKLVACAIWEEKDGGLYFGRLAVHPSARGQGLARGLLAMAEAEARRRNLPVLRLSTRLALTENRALFAAIGFVEVALKSHDGYPAPTYVDMEKPLPPEQAG